MKCVTAFQYCYINYSKSIRPNTWLLCCNYVRWLIVAHTSCYDKVSTYTSWWQMVLVVILLQICNKTGLKKQSGVRTNRLAVMPSWNSKTGYQYCKATNISQGVRTKNSHLRFYLCHSVEFLNTMYKLPNFFTLKFAVFVKNYGSKCNHTAVVKGIYDCKM